MTFDEYGKKAAETAIYPQEVALPYLVLGLTSEAGEVAGKLKKIMRDNENHFDALVDEVGDVLWYCSMICRELNVSLDDVAATNINKLHSRMARDKIKGSGDER